MLLNPALRPPHNTAPTTHSTVPLRSLPSARARVCVRARSQVLLSIAVWAMRLFLVAVQACCVGIVALLFALVTYVLLYMSTVPQVTHTFPLTFQYPHQDGVPALRNSAILPADVAAAYSGTRGMSGGVALIAGALPPAYATDASGVAHGSQWAKRRPNPSGNAAQQGLPLARADAADNGGLALPAEPILPLPEQPSGDSTSAHSSHSEANFGLTIGRETDSLEMFPDGHATRYTGQSRPSQASEATGAPGRGMTDVGTSPSAADEREATGRSSAGTAAAASSADPSTSAAAQAASPGSLEGSPEVTATSSASTSRADPTADPDFTSSLSSFGSAGRAQNKDPTPPPSSHPRAAGARPAALPGVDVGSALQAVLSALGSALDALWSAVRWLMATLWWLGRIVALPAMWVVEAAWWTLTRPAAFLIFALPPLPHGSWAMWAATAGGGGVIPAPSPLPAHVVSPFEAAAAASSIAPPGSPVAVSRVRSTRVEPWQATSSMRSTAPRDVDRLLAPNQGYDVVLLLHTPTSIGRERDVNEVFGAGVFMAQLELLGPRAELLARCSAPFQLRRQHWAVSAAEDLLRALLPGARWALPLEGSVRRRCADGFVDPPEAPLTTVRASVSSREARVLSGELRLEAQLEGFAFAMHHWFVASALLGVGYLLTGYCCCFGCCCAGANVAVLAAMDDEEDSTGAGPLLEVLGLRRAWADEAAAAARRRNREQMPRARAYDAAADHPPRGWQDRGNPQEGSYGRAMPQPPLHGGIDDGPWEQGRARPADDGPRTGTFSRAESDAGYDHSGFELGESGRISDGGHAAGPDEVPAGRPGSRTLRAVEPPGSHRESRSRSGDSGAIRGRSRSRSPSDDSGRSGRIGEERGRALSNSAATAAALDAERRIADYTGAARAAAAMAGAVPGARQRGGLEAGTAATGTVRVGVEPTDVSGRPGIGRADAGSECSGSGDGSAGGGRGRSGRGAGGAHAGTLLDMAAADEGSSRGRNGGGRDDDADHGSAGAARAWHGGRDSEVASDDGEHDVLGVI